MFHVLQLMPEQMRCGAGTGIDLDQMPAVPHPAPQAFSFIMNVKSLQAGGAIATPAAEPCDGSIYAAPAPLD